MDPRRAAIGKSSLPMLAVNEAAILEVTQRKPDCNTTDTKSSTKLVFAGDGKGGLLVPGKNFFGYRGDKTGSGC